MAVLGLTLFETVGGGCEQHWYTATLGPRRFQPVFDIRIDCHARRVLLLPPSHPIRAGYRCVMLSLILIVQLRHQRHCDREYRTVTPSPCSFGIGYYFSRFSRRQQSLRRFFSDDPSEHGHTACTRPQ
jgi:hypothetical protein